jgi:hypothetical protein
VRDELRKRERIEARREWLTTPPDEQTLAVLRNVTGEPAAAQTTAHGVLRRGDERGNVGLGRVRVCELTSGEREVQVRALVGAVVYYHAVLPSTRLRVAESHVVAAQPLRLDAFEKALVPDCAAKAIDA